MEPVISAISRTAPARTAPALTAALAALLSFAGFARAQDAVEAMCLDRDPPEVCACASAALKEEVGEEDYRVYERVGEGYLERRAAGEAMADAWTAALEPVAAALGVGRTALMSRTNVVGAAHRKAIKACAD